MIDVRSADIAYDEPKNPLERLKAALLNAGFEDGSFDQDLAYDDGNREIQAIIKISVTSANQAQKIVQIAHENGFGVMPMGSKTSAVGAFEAHEAAELHSLNGWVGLQINPSGKVSHFGDGKCSGTSEINGNCFEVIPVLNGRARILKSDDPKNIPHRIQAWGGVFPKELDDALAENLGPGHSIYLDLTTRDSAQLSGVIATGGQGPTRANATLNLERVVIVDGEGGLKTLEGEEAKRQVGLGGLAGAIVEAELEVIREMEHEFGLFIPLPGNTEEGLKRKFPKLMAALGQLTAYRLEEGVMAPQHGAFLIKGFEIVTQKGMQQTHESLNEQTQKAAKSMAGNMSQFMLENKCSVGLMINGRTQLDQSEMEEQMARLIVKSEELSESDMVSALRSLLLGETLFVDKEGADDDFYPEPYIERFSDRKMEDFRAVREGMAVAARESKDLGPTKSTDINLRVTSKDPQEIEKAYEKIWEIYYKYVEDMDARGAKIDIYGHNHPGGETGGGVDAHIRITFPLKDNDHQKRAAENVNYLSERQSKLYAELIALNGQFLIAVEAGEKGLLMNSQHIRRMEEETPEVMESYWQYIQKYGGRTFALREKKFSLHAHPPRIPGGLSHYFDSPPYTSKSILRWSQNSHCSPEGEKVLGEVYGLVRDWLKLGLEDRVFFAESPEKALHSSLLSLTDYKGGEKTLDLRSGGNIDQLNENVGTVVISDPTHLDDEKLRSRRVILVVDHDQPVSSEILSKTDAVIYSAKKLGASGDMGVVVTNIKAVKRCRQVKAAGNKGDYLHSFDKLNDKPHTSIETPPMQIIGEMGYALEQKMGHVSSSSPKIRRPDFISLNPGPSQINARVLEYAGEIDRWAANLEMGSPGERLEKVANIKSKLRHYLGVPDDYEIFFGGSATQAMQQIAESLDLHSAVALNNGAFADRQERVVGHFAPSKNRVKSVKMRWGAGTNSAVSAIDEMRREEEKLKGERRGRFIASHETSTGVQMDVAKIIQELDPNILNIVDGTSEIGAIQRDFRNIDVYFGSVQKFFGLPAGLSITIVSPRAMESAKQATEERAQRVVEGKNEAPVFRTFHQMQGEAKQGQCNNLRGILQLGVALDDYIGRGGMEVIASETREKMAALEIFVDDNPHLEWAVVERVDRSEILLHLVGVDRLADDVRRKMREMGVEIGAGYGPYAGETMEIYLSPNVTKSQILETIERLREVLQSAQSVNSERPVLSRSLV